MATNDERRGATPSNCLLQTGFLQTFDTSVIMIQRVFEFESVLLLLQQFLPYKNLISPGFPNLSSVVCRTQNPNLITLFNKVAGHVGGGVSMVLLPLTSVNGQG
jgi:hypothetical protein